MEALPATPASPPAAIQDVDLTGDAVEVSHTISWHEPHPIFVIVLVGKDEIPYGIQKDLLCAQSPHYREDFKKQGADKVEHLVRLPDTDIDVFGCFQNFIYTGYVYDRRTGREIPDYPLLMGVWKLATELKMAPLRTAVLDVMTERRNLTNAIPGSELLKQAWRDTEEGSGLRKMLIGWTAEHMRSSPEVRNSFAKSLPQEILSELVIVMSDLPSSPPFAPRAVGKHQLGQQEGSHYESPYRQQGSFSHPPAKRARKSENHIGINGDDTFEAKPHIKKVARKSEPVARKPKGRMTNNSASGGVLSPTNMDPDRDLAYCRDLIQRMLSGPGYWTRLVGPFKDPVDPVTHNAPNYFDVVKRPMDLKQIKAKMDRNDYATSTEFEADVRLIFQNCYEYWTPDDPVFRDCENFEKYFDDKWSKRDKWNPPTVKMEIAD